jgi:hypothetical protein
MFSCDQSTKKSFPLRAENVVIGAPPPGGLFGRSKPSRFAMTTDADEVAAVIVMGGRFFAMIDGRRIELRHTREALAALRGR